MGDLVATGKAPKLRSVNDISPEEKQTLMNFFNMPKTFDGREISPELIDSTLSFFLFQANRMGLDPYKNEIKLLWFGKTDWETNERTIQFTTYISYYTYLKVASQHPDYDGPEIEMDEGKEPKWIVVKIHRKSQKFPTVRKLLFDELKNVKNPLWGKNGKPRMMLELAGLAAGLRFAFPDLFDGCFTEDEVDYISDSAEVAIKQNNQRAWLDFFEKVTTLGEITVSNAEKTCQELFEKGMISNFPDIENAYDKDYLEIIREELDEWIKTEYKRRVNFIFDKFDEYGIKYKARQLAYINLALNIRVQQPDIYNQRAYTELLEKIDFAIHKRIQEQTKPQQPENQDQQTNGQDQSFKEAEKEKYEYALQLVVDLKGKGHQVPKDKAELDAEIEEVGIDETIERFEYLLEYGAEKQSQGVLKL